MSVDSIKKDLRSYVSHERKESNEWFFKTMPGEYGAHDKFLGISSPDVRQVAKKYKDVDLSNLQKLITSRYNEERFFALVVLANRFAAKKTTEKEREGIYGFYIKNIAHVNNWNLVDLSAPNIVGEYLFLHKSERKILDKLVKAPVQWERRICILATLAFIRKNDFSVTLRYTKKLLSDKEDLMHKAVGWMLREVWKRNAQVCEKFLKENYDNLPRTTLRYAIEKMEERKRKRFLHGKI